MLIFNRSDQVFVSSIFELREDVLRHDKRVMLRQINEVTHINIVSHCSQTNITLPHYKKSQKGKHGRSKPVREKKISERQTVGNHVKCQVNML